MYVDRSLDMHRCGSMQNASAGQSMWLSWKFPTWRHLKQDFSEFFFLLAAGKCLYSILLLFSRQPNSQTTAHELTAFIYTYIHRMKIRKKSLRMSFQKCHVFCHDKVTCSQAITIFSFQAFHSWNNNLCCLKSANTVYSSWSTYFSSIIHTIRKRKHLIQNTVIIAADSSS